MQARESCPLFAGAAYEATRRLIRRSPDITALFAVGDMAALGAIRALREAGLEPGRDVSVVGYGDLSVAGAFGLTTIRSRAQEIGRLAARALLGALDGEPRTVVLAPKLVVRDTAAPLRSGSPRRPAS